MLFFDFVAIVVVVVVVIFVVRVYPRVRTGADTRSTLIAAAAQVLAKAVADSAVDVSVQM